MVKKSESNRYCGRYGKANGKLTQSIPKCLLKFNGKSLLKWTIEGLEKSGCNDIWIITGYKSEEIEKLGYKIIENKDYRIIIYSIFFYG